jgi:hypothetical protein
MQLKNMFSLLDESVIGEMPKCQYGFFPAKCLLEDQLKSCIFCIQIIQIFDALLEE